MKKTIKRTVLAITILFALIGGTVTVACSSGYITRGGTPDFEQTIVNLDLISKRGRELKANNEGINRELEQMRNQLLDKDNKINSLEQEIEALEKRVEGNKTTRSEEHTSELQSRGHLVCRLLLEKKNKNP